MEAEVLFASHHWPRWGNERIQEVLRGQRGLYAHMNKQVLHFANQGVTINEIHNEGKYLLAQEILNKLARCVGRGSARRWRRKRGWHWHSGA